MYSRSQSLFVGPKVVGAGGGKHSFSGGLTQVCVVVALGAFYDTSVDKRQLDILGEPVRQTQVWCPPLAVSA